MQPRKVIQLSKDEKLELMTQQRKVTSLKLAINDMTQKFLQEDAAFGQMVARIAKEYRVDAMTHQFDVDALEFRLKP
jgi:hypothetical protein